MKRLILKKLIVISQSESKSLEVPFAAGLNIIMGGNKTGKSSIIKSLFTAFGCECPKIESDWKQLISSYILFFTVDNADYCIQRIKDRFFPKNVRWQSVCPVVLRFHQFEASSAYHLSPLYLLGVSVFSAIISRFLLTFK